MTWTWPAANTVPGSESLTLWALGDISGPLLTVGLLLLLLLEIQRDITTRVLINNTSESNV